MSSNENNEAPCGYTRMQRAREMPDDHVTMQVMKWLAILAVLLCMA